MVTWATQSYNLHGPRTSVARQVVVPGRAFPLGYTDHAVHDRDRVTTPTDPLELLFPSPSGATCAYIRVHASVAFALMHTHVGPRYDASVAIVYSSPLSYSSEAI